MSAQDILHNNILDNETTAILAYDWPLRGFYKYAQQLEMESNGKRVDKNGNNIDYQTNPIVLVCRYRHSFTSKSLVQKT